MNTKVATLLSILTFKSSIFANDPVGHWRFDSENSEVGAPITETTNFANPGTHDASLQGGNPLFSSEVPGKKSTTQFQVKSWKIIIHSMRLTQTQD
ncbi:MAG: hypothetical protein VYA96_01660 [Verrucomicrobiota bacterium]|nr:hypothetical protein [Verrucomicrobiota bacterium]